MPKPAIAAGRNHFSDKQNKLIEKSLTQILELAPFIADGNIAGPCFFPELAAKSQSWRTGMDACLAGTFL